MSIFEYAFMQRAFIVGILLGMTIPCIGTIIVLKDCLCWEIPFPTHPLQVLPVDWYFI